ncbi:hypothetical protein Ancab_000523 [Ancistrocladus abbreviatus]
MGKDEEMIRRLEDLESDASRKKNENIGDIDMKITSLNVNIERFDLFDEQGIITNIEFDSRRDAMAKLSSFLTAQ